MKSRLSVSMTGMMGLSANRRQPPQLDQVYVVAPAEPAAHEFPCARALRDSRSYRRGGFENMAALPAWFCRGRLLSRTAPSAGGVLGQPDPPICAWLATNVSVRKQFRRPGEKLDEPGKSCKNSKLGLTPWMTPWRNDSSATHSRSVTSRPRKTVSSTRSIGCCSIGGVLKVFDQAPEGFESLVDVHRASPLLGCRREIKLDRDSIGSEHDSGSSSMGCVPGLTTSWNIPHEEGHLVGRLLRGPRPKPIDQQVPEPSNVKAELRVVTPNWLMRHCHGSLLRPESLVLYVFTLLFTMSIYQAFSKITISTG